MCYWEASRCTPVEHTCVFSAGWLRLFHAKSNQLAALPFPCLTISRPDKHIHAVECVRLCSARCRWECRTERSHCGVCSNQAGGSPLTKMRLGLTHAEAGSPDKCPLFWSSTFPLPVKHLLVIKCTFQPASSVASRHIWSNTCATHSPPHPLQQLLKSARATSCSSVLPARAEGTCGCPLPAAP